MHERSVFMRVAPHLVHPLPFLIPTYGHFMRGQKTFHLALLANDLIGCDRGQLQDPEKYLPRGRMISRAECLRLIPGLEEKDLTGAAIIYDSQMTSSERLVVSFARSAAEAGAEIANYVEVIGFLQRGDHLFGVKAKDLLIGEDLEIRAKIIVNTSGPWLDRVAGLLDNHRSRPRQILSKAFNIAVNRQWTTEYAFGVYSKERFKDQDAILDKGSRLFFITPWHNRSLIGTAHLPYDGNPDALKITEAEVQKFLAEINSAFPSAGLTRQDVSFVYAGQVPMEENGNGGGDVQLMKKYRIHDHGKDDRVHGLISVSGVKFTEARHVAEKAVRLVFQKLGKAARLRQNPGRPSHRYTEDKSSGSTPILLNRYDETVYRPITSDAWSTITAPATQEF
jgi:glycerol-3-phosphate dehydrogenase